MMDTPMSTSSAQAPSQTSSVSFADLPAELRLEIWRLAIPQPRVRRMNIETANETDPYAWAMSTPTIPTILHVNHESRTVGLSIFRYGFGLHLPRRKLAEHKRFQTYWNAETDILYIPRWNPQLLKNTTDIEEERDECHFAEAYMNFIRSDHFLYSEFHPADIYADRTSSDLLEASKTTIFYHTKHIALRFPGGDLGAEAAPGAYLEQTMDFLESLPNLESLTFLIEHWPTWYRAGEIVLYEPEPDIPFGSRFQHDEPFYHLTVSQTTNEIVQRLGVLRNKRNRDGESSIELPFDVKILIVGNKRNQKRDPFCI